MSVCFSVKAACRFRDPSAASQPELVHQPVDIPVLQQGRHKSAEGKPERRERVQSLEPAATNTGQLVKRNLRCEQHRPAGEAETTPTAKTVLLWRFL